MWDGLRQSCFRGGSDCEWTEEGRFAWRDVCECAVWERGIFPSCISFLFFPFSFLFIICPSLPFPLLAGYFHSSLPLLSASPPFSCNQSFSHFSFPSVISVDDPLHYVPQPPYNFLFNLFYLLLNLHSTLFSRFRVASTSLSRIQSCGAVPPETYILN